MSYTKQSVDARTYEYNNKYKLLQIQILWTFDCWLDQRTVVIFMAYEI